MVARTWNSSGMLLAGPLPVAFAMLAGCRSHGCHSLGVRETAVPPLSRPPMAAPVSASPAAEQLPTGAVGSAAAVAKPYGGQKTCPVTGEALESMGTPVPVTVRGQTVYVCCRGCVSIVQRDPDTYLAKVMAERAAP